MASGGQARTVRSDVGVVIVQRVAKLNAKLASEEGGDETVLESLRQLQSVRMTFEALEATKVGRAVNALRKSAASEQAREIAAELYRRWKALADEHFAMRRRARAAATAAAEAAAPKVVVDGSVVARPSPPVEAKEKEKKKPAAGAESAPAVIQKPRNILRLVIKRPPNGGGSNEQPAAASQAATANHQRRSAVASKRVFPAATSAASLAKQQAKPPPKTALTKPPAPPTAAPKPSGSGACKRKAAPAAGMDEARPHMRKIQVIGAVASKRVCPATSAASLAKQQVKPPTKTALTKPPAPPTAAPKPSGSGACKRKAAMAAGMDEARLAMAKKRLHERYEEASNAKEKRKIHVIAAAPGKGRRAPVSSCTRRVQGKGIMSSRGK